MALTNDKKMCLMLINYFLTRIIYLLNSSKAAGAL